ARAADRGLRRARGRPARSARTGGVVDRAALLARRPARARARRGERREARARPRRARLVGATGARVAGGAVSDFKAFEVAGWSAEGKALRYDALAGRLTRAVVEPLLDALDVRVNERFIDVATGPGHLAA